MQGIYNREALFQQNMVDGKIEYDMGSIDFPELFRDQNVGWTVVRSPEENRPDLIAQRVYDDPDLWWFIMWFNGICDPWNDLRSGVALKYIDKTKIDNAVKYVRMRRG
jgi:hypothetical protein